VGQLSSSLATSLAVLALTVLIVVVLAAALSRGRSRGRREARAGSSNPGHGTEPGISRGIPVGPGRPTDPAPVGENPEVQPRPLGEADRVRYQAAWRHVQSIFVEEPWAGIADADDLVENVIRARGYRVPGPATDGPGAAGAAGEILDANHPLVRYRAGHGVAVRRGDPGIQPADLWSAMADYQAVLDALLEPVAPAASQPPEPVGAGRPLTGVAP
jgi:hypothetical protein